MASSGDMPPVEVEGEEEQVDVDEDEVAMITLLTALVEDYDLADSKDDEDWNADEEEEDDDEDMEEDGEEIADDELKSLEEDGDKMEQQDGETMEVETPVGCAHTWKLDNDPAYARHRESFDRTIQSQQASSLGTSLPGTSAPPEISIPISIGMEIEE